MKDSTAEKQDNKLSLSPAGPGPGDKIDLKDFQPLDKSTKFKSVDIAKLGHAGQQDREAIEKLSLKKWRQHLAKNQSIVSDVMMGQYLSKLECTVCKCASYNFEPFYVLELALPSGKDFTSLTELLANSSKEDVVDGFMWDCPKCQTPRQASKCTFIYKLPPVLVVCYKRFEVVQGKVRKNTCMVKMDVGGEDLGRFEHGSRKAGSKTYAPYMIIVSSIEAAPSR